MKCENISLNKNHHLYVGRQYESLPLISGSQPMIREYLEVLSRVVENAMAEYCRVFAFRFDLHMPKGIEACSVDWNNSMISRFLNSLKAKIRHNRKAAEYDGSVVHQTRVRYFWVREVGDLGRVHYHFVVLLNGNAFNWLGLYQLGRENMVNRIWEAWASALHETVECAMMLVHFPVNPTYNLFRSDPATIAAFFQRASYLCKARTKQYGLGHHGYGASRG
ncbi:inovirus Gp2 family protein [Acidovorax sp. SDU_ACID1]|uniref:inovirus Gp2 family protein n=1 Tax=Acidovorax sp. SDU_ACID1 TaxID=3136632 RepID=UPI003872D629